MNGERVGRYRLRGKIGEGGMGIVYLAEDVRTGSRVALKRVAAADPRLLASCRTELAALARFDHPGVVRVVDSGTEGGMPWYAMEWIDGTTLAKVFAKTTEASPEFVSRNHTSAPTRREVPLGAMPTALAVEDSTITRAGLPLARARLEPLPLLARLATALAYVHGMGVVHRDVKPDNVLVRGDDDVVLVDFGLVDVSHASPEGREQLTIALARAGTAPYMAPEQIEGKLADPRADLYSLGCILYEALTGRVPFVGESPADVIYQHMSTRPLAPSDLVSGIPRELDELTLALLEKQPSRRPAYAVDVATILQRHSAMQSAPPSSSIRPYLYRPPLTGRKRSLETIVSAIERGNGVTLIGGESGIGKTRLALELVHQRFGAQRRVFVGCCQSCDRRPLGGLHAVFQRIADMSNVGSGRAARRLVGDERTILARYVSVLAPLADKDDDGRDSDTALQDRTQLYAATTKVLGRMAAERPLLLVLDDVQWADELTWGWLAHFASEHSHIKESLAVLATYRPESPNEALHALRQRPDVCDITLGAIKEDDVREIVSAMLAVETPPAPLVDFLSATAFGNPFFVTEVLHSAVRVGLIRRANGGVWEVDAELFASESMTELGRTTALPLVLHRRLDELDDDARQTLELAALIGNPIPHALLIACGAGSGPDIDTLLSEGFLVSNDHHELRFVHARMRELTYHNIAPNRRRSHQERIAEAIDGTACAGESFQWARCADHYRAAGQASQAAHAYCQAAQGALALGQVDFAVSMLQQRLRVIRRDSQDAHDTRLTILRAQLDAGRLKEARRGAARMCDANAGETPQQQARALLCLAEAYEKLGKPDQALERLRAHHQLFDQLADVALSARLAEQTASVLASQSNPGAARERLAAAMAMYSQLDDPLAIARCRDRLASIATSLDEYDEAEVQYMQSLSVYRVHGERRLQARALAGLAFTKRHRGNLDQARTLLLQAIALHRRVGDRLYQGISAAYLGLVEVERKQLREGKLHFEHAITVLRELGAIAELGFALTGLGMALIDDQQADAAVPHLERAVNLLRDAGRAISESYAHVYLASAFRHQGDLQRARAELHMAETLLLDHDDAYANVYLAVEAGHQRLARKDDPTPALQRAWAENARLPESASSGPARLIAALEDAMREHDRRVPARHAQYS